IETQALQTARPAELLARVNRQLVARLQANHMNAAVLFALIDLKERRLYVANAGMIAPLLLRAGALTYLDAGGLPLGVLPGARYAEVAVDLLPGDCLLLVSDGIVEARNRQRELFGFERLERAVAEVADADRDELIDYVIDQVDDFVAGGIQHDDMTMIAIAPALAGAPELEPAVS
ncbi:MAG TPA: PP2C family protein-serine/threonine phosphatase, partial [Herpetosiphonaceae bacterium]